MNKIVIAIDGLSGCGKSSTAKAVAKALGYVYIDSGAMYRAATLHFLDRDTELTSEDAVAEALADMEIRFRPGANGSAQDTYLNGRHVEQEIRTMRVSNYVSKVSKLKAVRRALVAQQQALGAEKGVVMDGRDIGTVVFPDAELKIYMSANLEVRAARRQTELAAAGDEVSLSEIMDNLASRDAIDSSREESPLYQAKDAHVIDTSSLRFEEQVEQILTLARRAMNHQTK
ncbi:MAG: (d)CMP kinase [Nitritalea sp.]